MLINPGVENIEERVQDEFKYLLRKYPTIAFNTRNWISGTNNRVTGRNILLATEGYITIPENYDPVVIKKYDAFITSNNKFKELHKDLNIYTINGVTNWDNYYWLDDFCSFEEKIKGICSLQTIYKTGKEGDINHLKHEVMRDLKVEPHLIIHTFGPTLFGKPESYQGKIGPKHHSHYEHFKKINQYLFCWCPESTYHPLWSYGHLTERLFNCFKSKTIAIYYGCYNVEELVPKELFIDFRDFEGLDSLADFLIKLSNDKDRYYNMVESAYEWNKTNKIGDVMELEKVLDLCTKKYKF